MKLIFRVYDSKGKDVTSEQERYIDIAEGTLCFMTDDIDCPLREVDKSEYTYTITMSTTIDNKQVDKESEYNSEVSSYSNNKCFFVKTITANDSVCACVYDNNNNLVYPWLTVADKVEWEEHKTFDNAYKVIDFFSTLDNTKYVIWSSPYVDDTKITKILG